MASLGSGTLIDSSIKQTVTSIVTYTVPSGCVLSITYIAWAPGTQLNVKIGVTTADTILSGTTGTVSTFPGGLEFGPGTIISSAANNVTIAGVLFRNP